MTAIFHLLIGCPASGKSTLAQRLAEQNPNCVIISTDRIRGQLYGDPSYQGDWEQIEAEVFTQLKRHLAEGKSIIYDATNAKRPWRQALLAKLQQFPQLQVIGWYLQTPLPVCLQRNGQREQPVPPSVIEGYHLALQQCPPTIDEGFAAFHCLDCQKLENWFASPDL